MCIKHVFKIFSVVLFINVKFDRFAHSWMLNTTIITQTYNILQHGKSKTLFLTTAATQQTFPQTTTLSLQQI